MVKTTGATTSSWEKMSYKNINNQGVTNVIFKACDPVGNCSAEVSYATKLDRTNPTDFTLKGCRKPNTNPASSCDNTWSAITNKKWSSGYGLVIASGSTDALSGFKTYVARGTGPGAPAGSHNQNRLNINADGKSTVYIKSCDKAGNCTAEKKFEVWLDNKAPALEVKGYKKATKDTTNLVEYNTETWYDGYATVKASATDNDGSGVSHYLLTTTGTTENVTDAKKNQRNVNAQGKSTVIFKACDKVGNCSSAKSFKVWLDRTDPECTTTKTQNGSSSGISGTIGCKDNYSGCKSGKDRKDFSDKKSAIDYTIEDNVGRKKYCVVNVSTSTKYQTCGGGKYTCYKSQSIGTTNKICYEKYGGKFTQTQQQTGHTLMGTCTYYVASTCTYPTYSCNPTTYYYFD